MTGVVPDVRLNNGTSIPQLGFGVLQVPDDEAERRGARRDRGRLPQHRHRHAVRQRGGRRAGGRVLRACRARSCSSPPSCGTTTRATTRRCGRSTRACDRLGLDYVDLYLIHWPMPSLDRYVETWRALEKLDADGRARRSACRTSSSPTCSGCSTRPTSSRPSTRSSCTRGCSRSELRAFHAEHGIATEAWSPLGQGQALQDPAVAELAEQHGRTPAQVVLRWHMQLGNVVIPKSTTPSRIRENIALFDFELGDEDMAALARAGRRRAPRPRPRRARHPATQGLLQLGGRTGSRKATTR